MTNKEFIQDHPEFYRWWKNHRHSGFIEDGEGRSHWNSTPAEAWHCTRYRVEFSADTGSPFRPRKVCGMEIVYTPEEIAQWAEEQSEHEARKSA